MLRNKILVLGLWISFASGCFTESFINSNSSSSLSEPVPFSASMSSLKLLDMKPITITGGTPPYTFDVLEGDVTVSAAGIVHSLSTKAAKIKVTDATGKSVVVEANPSLKDNITGKNVVSVKFSQDKTKAVITAVDALINYTVFAASFDEQTADFSNLVEVTTTTNIPTLNKVCSAAQIQPAGNKIIFSADTTPGGNIDECELWVIDFNGQNALMLSEELSPAGGGNRSVTSEVFSSDGSRVLYLDGEDPAFVDNERALKIVNLDGSNFHRLHPVVTSDWGVTSFAEVPGANRVLFNHNNPANSNYYRTYTARMDGSDSGALVTASSTTGSVGIGSTGTLFDNNSKVVFYSSKTAGLLNTVEIANVDGTGKVVVENNQTGSISIIYASPSSPEIVYAIGTFPTSLVIKKYSTITGFTTLVNIPYPSVQFYTVQYGYLYYFALSGAELRRVALDGTGDTLISPAALAGRVHAAYVLPNNDVYFVAEKNTNLVAELYKYKFAANQVINISPTTYTLGSALGRFGTIFTPMGSNSFSVKICPGNYTLMGGCQVAYKYLYAKLTDDTVATEFDDGPVTNSSVMNFLSQVNSMIQIKWGSFGVRTYWYGL